MKASGSFCLLLLLAACNAHVDSFSASSHTICAGQPVQLVWKVTGNATMTATPPLAPLAGALDATFLALRPYLPGLQAA